MTPTRDYRRFLGPVKPKLDAIRVLVEAGKTAEALVIFDEIGIAPTPTKQELEAAAVARIEAARAAVAAAEQELAKIVT